MAYFKPPVKPDGVKIIIFHGEINPPDAIHGGGGGNGIVMYYHRIGLKRLGSN